MEDSENQRGDAVDLTEKTASFFKSFNDAQNRIDRIQEQMNNFKMTNAHMGSSKPEWHFFSPPVLDDGPEGPEGAEGPEMPE